MKTISLKLGQLVSLNEITKALLMSLLISLFANVAIYMPFTPVPITLQNTLCLFMGITLGKRTGALAVLLFLIEGLIGLPVFAGGGSTLTFIGPTGGYLIGYLVGTYVTGAIYEKKKDTMGAFLALSIGTLMVYAFGFIRLSLLLGMEKAFLLGVLPFLLTGFLKIGLLAKGLEYIGTKKSL